MFQFKTEHSAPSPPSGTASKPPKIPRKVPKTPHKVEPATHSIPPNLHMQAIENATPASEQAKKEYAEFEAKVKRTVFLDNLSPQVTVSVIKTALGQFGNVKNVEFIPNYTIPYNIPQNALIEMDNAKQATNVISEITNYPFMMSGMPRPIRARAAEVEMFADRPRPPGRKIQVRWLEPSDPDFEVAKKLKQQCRRHQAETLAIVKLQLDEEEKLSKQQAEMLKSNYKKYEMIEGLMQDGTAPRLARYYGVNFNED